MDTKAEKEALELIFETQAELSMLLAAIQPDKLTGIQKYVWPLCVGIADLVKGFHTLKKADNTHAARVLIRTCIETTLKVTAVLKKPSSLYRIAFTEQLGDVSFLKAADENQIVVKPEMLDGRWAKIAPGLRELFPGEELKDAPVSAETLAQWAELPALYDFYFKLYCNYTHATFRAHALPKGFSAEVDYTANLGCLWAASVVAAEALGTKSAKLHDYVERLKAFGAPPVVGEA